MFDWYIHVYVYKNTHTYTHTHMHASNIPLLRIVTSYTHTLTHIYAVYFNCLFKLIIFYKWLFSDKYLSILKFAAFVYWIYMNFFLNKMHAWLKIIWMMTNTKVTTNLDSHLYFRKHVHAVLAVKCKDWPFANRWQSFLQLDPSRSIPNGTLFATISRSLYFGTILIHISYIITHTHTYTRARVCMYVCMYVYAIMWQKVFIVEMNIWAGMWNILL